MLKKRQFGLNTISHLAEFMAVPYLSRDCNVHQARRVEFNRLSTCFNDAKEYYYKFLTKIL